ncbi:hypothetical protein DSO57_1001782 [Entomophthora muscae]|uniref:Uncharacterized protein n=1 Tax=Entomophthora muscae TaxID=34485 RepID=A0ACC2T9Q2_9FUNG|nr:hypothetical protein DSO57_1001782 [Entomophthora muscae]
MALNWVTLNTDGRSPVPLENERTFFCQGGVSFRFTSGSGYPGSSELYSSAKGNLFLTNLRAVFISIPQTQLNCEIVQPIFGPNYCKADLEPVPGGGIRQNGTLKLFFKEGGGFSFLALYKQLVQRRLEVGDGPEHLEPLPLYQPPSNPQIGSTASQIPVSPPDASSSHPDLPPSYDAISSSEPPSFSAAQ